MRVFERCHQGCKRGRREGKGGNRGKIKSKLSEVNTWDVSRGQNELISKFKMAAGDMISIRGQVMVYMYIPIGIKKELARFGVDCYWKG